MNALVLLKTDHKNVETLFHELESAKGAARKRRIVTKIIKELSVHAAIEEQLFYPFVRKHLKAQEDEVLESLEEHHIVKWLLSELDGMDPEAERYDAKVKVLSEIVLHHAKEEEEGKLFPKIRKAISKKQLEELGVALANAKKIAPTRPHPRAPDTPPGNLVAGPGAAVVDRLRDGARKLAGKVSAGPKRKTVQRTVRAAATSNGSNGQHVNGRARTPTAVA